MITRGESLHGSKKRLQVRFWHVLDAMARNSCLYATSEGGSCKLLILRQAQALPPGGGCRAPACACRRQAATPAPCPGQPPPGPLQEMHQASAGICLMDKSTSGMDIWTRPEPCPHAHTCGALDHRGPPYGPDALRLPYKFLILEKRGAAGDLPPCAR